MEYYDEITQVESSVDGEGLPVTSEDLPSIPTDFATKVFQLDNLSLELGSNLSSPHMEGE